MVIWFVVLGIVCNSRWCFIGYVVVFFDDLVLVKGYISVDKQIDECCVGNVVENDVYVIFWFKYGQNEQSSLDSCLDDIDDEEEVQVEGFFCVFDYVDDVENEVKGNDKQKSEIDGDEFESICVVIFVLQVEVFVVVGFDEDECDDESDEVESEDGEMNDVEGNKNMF